MTTSTQQTKNKSPLRSKAASLVSEALTPLSKKDRRDLLAALLLVDDGQIEYTKVAERLPKHIATRLTRTKRALKNCHRSTQRKIVRYAARAAQEKITLKKPEREKVPPHPLIKKHAKQLEEIKAHAHKLMRRSFFLEQLEDSTRIFAKKHYPKKAYKIIEKQLDYIFERRGDAEFITDVPKKIDRFLATAPCILTAFRGLTTKETLSYGDVVLAGRRSSVHSRSLVSLETQLTNKKRSAMQSPVVLSNMRAVISEQLADKLIALGIIPIMHRYKRPLNPKDVDSKKPTVQTQEEADREKIAWAIKYREKAYFSCGTNRRSIEFAKKLIDLGVGGICVDVAIGNADSTICTVIELREYIKKAGKKTQIIAGNVDSAEGYLLLALAGANSVKVGIGPGSACTTRIVTGAGTGQASALMAVAKARFLLGKKAPSFIADGGIGGSKDLLVAIALGASAAMLGKAAARVKGSGALRRGKKLFYHGEASEPARLMEDGKVKKGMVVEGGSSWISEGGTLEELLLMLEGGLRNAFPYYNARSIKELQRKYCLENQLCDLILGNETGLNKAATGMGTESHTRLRD